VRKWLSSLIKAVVAFATIICFAMVHHFFSLSTRSANDSWLTFNIILLIFFIFGLLLGIEHLVCEIQKKGKWRVNLPRLILLGLPSLFLGLYFNLYYTSIPFLKLLARHLPAYLAQSPICMQLSILLLGYIMATSFQRVPAKQKTL
jgi:hypothetical protein